MTTILDHLINLTTVVGLLVLLAWLATTIWLFRSLADETERADYWKRRYFEAEGEKLPEHEPKVDVELQLSDQLIGRPAMTPSDIPQFLRKHIRD